MIKLVVTDMDGTLLDEKSRMPEGIYGRIVRLAERGVRFCAASGRRFDTLQELFAPVADAMDFVASNGAQVVVGGVLVDREVFSHAALRRLLDVVREFPCLHLVVFDRTNSFLLDERGRFKAEFDKDLPNPVCVADLPPAGVSILKASVYCDEEPMDMAYVLSRELDAEFVFAPSGNRWIDVMQRGVNKATGVRQVMRAYGIEACEVMAFGDAMNDYELLRMAGESRAMGNGRYAVRQIAERVIGTNAEHAVLHEIDALLDATAES